MSLLHVHGPDCTWPCRDLDVLMVPLLQQLYAASSRTPSQLYMLLIVILILSQDAVFARNLHQITLPSVPWFKERLLQKSTLGQHARLPVPVPGAMAWQCIFRPAVMQLLCQAIRHICFPAAGLGSVCTGASFASDAGPPPC